MLIVLLLIDCMARSSDLTTITRETIVFGDDDTVTFDYYFTKEAKGPGPIRTTIRGYHQDRRICTVATLKQYIIRTTRPDIIIPPVQHVIHGTIVNRTPLIIYENKDPLSNTYPALKSDRMSKPTLTALAAIGEFTWKAHGVRGASASKCVNLVHSSRTAVCIRARWATEQTFNESYFIPCHYKESENQDLRLSSLEYLLRFNGTRLDH